MYREFCVQFKLKGHFILFSIHRLQAIVHTKLPLMTGKYYLAFHSIDSQRFGPWTIVSCKVHGPKRPVSFVAYLCYEKLKILSYSNESLQHTSNDVVSE